MVLFIYLLIEEKSLWSSFIFTVCVRSVPCYHFKLAYIVSQMAAKEFFETPFKNGEIVFFNEAEKWSFKSKICKPKISSFVIKKP